MPSTSRFSGALSIGEEGSFSIAVSGEILALRLISTETTTPSQIRLSVKDNLGRVIGSQVVNGSDEKQITLDGISGTISGEVVCLSGAARVTVTEISGSEAVVPPNPDATPGAAGQTDLDGETRVNDSLVVGEDLADFEPSIQGQYPVAKDNNLEPQWPDGIISQGGVLIMPKQTGGFPPFSSVPALHPYALAMGVGLQRSIHSSDRRVEPPSLSWSGFAHYETTNAADIDIFIEHVVPTTQDASALVSARVCAREDAGSGSPTYVKVIEAVCKYNSSTGFWTIVNQATIYEHTGDLAAAFTLEVEICLGVLMYRSVGIAATTIHWNAYITMLQA